MELVELLGPNPMDSNAIKVNFHPELVTRWGHGLKNGIKREERRKALEKYSLAGNCDLETPLVNLEISSSMNETSRNRDGYTVDYQTQLGSAIAAVGKLISEALVAGITEDNKPLVGALSDIGVILVGLHHQMSLSRRILILKGVDKLHFDIMKKLPIEHHLFGDNLGDVLKAAGVAIKLGLGMKPTPQNKPGGSFSGNGKTPSGKKKYRAGKSGKQGNAQQNNQGNQNNSNRPNTRRGTKVNSNNSNPPAKE